MFLLRHGQSYFNLHFTETRRDPGIEDPELTELGHAQAKEAARRLTDRGIRRVIVSPYMRALQTAQPFLALPGVKMEVMHEVRERTAFVCDIGSSPALLAGRFPHHEFGHLPERWWHQDTESEEETVMRAEAFRKAMAGGPDHDSTLLVSHWGFILALTGYSVANGEWIEFDPAGVRPEHIDWRH
ncbi:histidine phosphatase family protein [Acidocella sp.]|uniref:histidine phosphatase family protein n=1 Tax=Acidocella sp. TaxID=50710 RepID=UPI003CFFE342